MLAQGASSLRRPRRRGELGLRTPRRPPARPKPCATGPGEGRKQGGCGGSGWTRGSSGQERRPWAEGEAHHGADGTQRRGREGGEEALASRAAKTAEGRAEVTTRPTAGGGSGSGAARGAGVGGRGKGRGLGSRHAQRRKSRPRWAGLGAG